MLDSIIASVIGGFILKSFDLVIYYLHKRK